MPCEKPKKHDLIDIPETETKDVRDSAAGNNEDKDNDYK